MKPNSSLLTTISLFALAVGGLGDFATETLGQQGIASPIDPKVTICYQNRTILVSQTTANSLITANLATLGACTNVTYQAMCYRGRNISVSPSVVSSMLAAGATLGACSPSLVGSGDGKSIAPGAVSSAASGVGSSVTPSTSPLAPLPPALVTPAIGRPNSPVQINEIDICYKGHTLSVMPTAVQTYLAIGGTLGPCSKTSTLKSESEEKSSVKKAVDAVEAAK